MLSTRSVRQSNCMQHWYTIYSLKYITCHCTFFIVDRQTINKSWVKEELWWQNNTNFLCDFAVCIMLPAIANAQGECGSSHWGLKCSVFWGFPESMPFCRLVHFLRILWECCDCWESPESTALPGLGILRRCSALWQFPESAALSKKKWKFPHSEEHTHDQVHYCYF